MPPKEENNQDNNAARLEKQLQAYRPVEGPTTRQLEWGLWWVEHRALLRNIVIIILLLVDVGFLGYSLFYLIDYGYNGILQDQQLARTSLQLQPASHAAITQSGARPLTLGTVQVFSGPTGTYDLASTVTNSNPNWYARFDYVFVVGQHETKLQSGFVMPRETKYLTHFLYAAVRPENAGLKLVNLQWYRIDPRETGDIVGFINEHLAIAVSDVTFGLGADGLNRASFTVANDSPYNYWAVDLYLTLTSGSRLTGINKYTVERLRSGETRGVELLWAASPAAGTLAVTPSIDVFDEENYMPFDLGTGQIK